jgi:hypothetical protein
MTRGPKRIGELLREKGLITDEQLGAALAEQKRTKEFLGAIFVKRGIIKERDFLRVLSKQYNIPLVSIKYEYINWELVKGFSPSLIMEHKCFPLARDEYYVTIAITNPLDVWAIKKAEEETRGYKLKLVLVPLGEMEEAIQRYQEYMHTKGL